MTSDTTTTPTKEKGVKQSTSDIGYHDPLSPYIHDTFKCSLCKNEATFICHECSKPFFPRYYCSSCATRKPNKFSWYCPECGGKLYELSETRKRFIGSKRFQQRMQGAGKNQRTVKKKGKIYHEGKCIKW